jgi:hypothetical protein
MICVHPEVCFISEVADQHVASISFHELHVGSRLIRADLGNLARKCRKSIGDGLHGVVGVLFIPAE